MISKDRVSLGRGAKLFLPPESAPALVCKITAKPSPASLRFTETAFASTLRPATEEEGNRRRQVRRGGGAPAWISSSGGGPVARRESKKLI